jgi:hypothetical protein
MQRNATRRGANSMRARRNPSKSGNLAAKREQVRQISPQLAVTEIQCDCHLLGEFGSSDATELLDNLKPSVDNGNAT